MRPVDVQRSAMQEDPPFIINIGIRQVGREQHVIAAHGRTEQQRTAVGEFELEAGEKSRSLVIEPFSGANFGIDITKPIE